MAGIGKRLVSGREPVKRPGDVAESRYDFLDISAAEPNLGTSANGAVLVSDTVGNRVWTSNVTLNTLRVGSLLYPNGVPYYGGSGSGSGSNAPYTYGDTAPASPMLGDRWFDTTTGLEYVWIVDGAHSTWIDSASPGGVGYTGSAGAGGGGGGGNGYTGSQGYTGSAGSFSGTTTRAIVTSNTTISTSTTTGALLVAGGAGIAGNVNIGGIVTVSNSILPTVANAIDIGSATMRFNKLYLAGNTINLGGTTISATPDNGLQFTTSSGNISLNANTVAFLSTVASTPTADAGNLNITGSVTTGNIYTNNYFYANGAPYYNTGATGSRGYTGSAGANGTIGYNGSSGYAGSTGYNGSTGYAGSTGYTGSRGNDGTSVRIIGSAATASTGAFSAVDASPVVGDGIIASDTGHLWVYSGTGPVGGFVDVGTIVGYTGSTGAAGYAGSQGTQGNAGYTGSAGAGGTSGAVGYTGSAGAVGYNGSTGYTGSIGTGYTGSRGTDGVIGYNGSAGYTGSAGANGTAGGGYVNLAMPGTITPPVTGTARFYPPVSMIINTVYANLSAAPLGGNLTFVIKKNGTTIGTTFVLSSALMTPVSASITIATTDYLTLDVGGGPGYDLNVKLKYV